MATTKIADLFVPEIWIPGVREAMATLPSLFNSPVVESDSSLDEIASGAGISVEVPFFEDITDTADQIQVEDTAPTPNKIVSKKQIAPLLNRVTPFQHTALARHVAGFGSQGDPVQEVMNQLAFARIKQRQRTMIQILRGFFTTALNANSVGDTVEVVGDVTATHLIDAEKIIDAAATLGERIESLGNCRLVAHSMIISALRKQDENSFIPASRNGSLGLDTYKGAPIIYSDTLVRDGTTSGKVYDTYLLAPGLVAWGEKPQSNEIGDVAHMVVDGDAHKNNLTMYDRTRFLLHINGARWVGTPDGQSATNAELATGASWQLAYASANRVPAARIMSNG